MWNRYNPRLSEGTIYVFRRVFANNDISIDTEPKCHRNLRFEPQFCEGVGSETSATSTLAIAPIFFLLELKFYHTLLWRR